MAIHKTYPRTAHAAYEPPTQKKLRLKQPASLEVTAYLLGEGDERLVRWYERVSLPFPTIVPDMAVPHVHFTIVYAALVVSAKAVEEGLPVRVRLELRAYCECAEWEREHAYTFGETMSDAPLEDSTKALVDLYNHLGGDHA
jgi:hypothetical protein